MTAETNSCCEGEYLGNFQLLYSVSEWAPLAGPTRKKGIRKKTPTRENEDKMKMTKESNIRVEKEDDE